MRLKIRPRLLESLEVRSMLSTVLPPAESSAPSVASPAPRHLEYLSFDRPALASQQATSATITLHRIAYPSLSFGLPQDTLQVHVTTGPVIPGPDDFTTGPVFPSSESVPSATPTAVAGIHYLPIDRTITFPPGVDAETIRVPIVAGAPNPGRIAFSVFATEIALDGAPSPGGARTAVFLSSNADVITPEIVGARLVKAGGKATGIAIRFNKPMDPASVQDVAAYNVATTSVSSADHGIFFDILFRRPFGALKVTTKTEPVRSATYDPTTDTVTLHLARPRKLGPRFDIQNATTSAHRQPIPPLQDLAGNRIGDSAGNGNSGFAISAA